MGYWAILNSSRTSGVVIPSGNARSDRAMMRRKTDLVVGYFLEEKRAYEAVSTALREREQEMSIKEASIKYHVPQDDIRRAINAGTLRAVGTRHHRRVLLTEFKRWLGE